MTDQPYTDDDLRAEAARQLRTATEDPDFSGISEQMEGHKIRSRGDFQWDQLGDSDFDRAQRAIDDLLGDAADVSEWAVNLGADGLEPEDHSITIKGDGQPVVRVHFAFASRLSDDAREAFVAAVGKVTAREMGLIQ